MIFYYTIEDGNHVYEYEPPKWSSRTYDLTDEWDQETLAEDCADDWFSNHDGWERRSWAEGHPVTFNLTDEQGKIIVSFAVACEYEPRFSAYRKE